MKEQVQMVITCIGGWIGWILGGYDGFLYALITLVVFDYLTGMTVAAFEQKLSSAVGFRGIAKKVLLFTLVGVGHILDNQVLGNGGVIRSAIIFFYISNEGLSILENVAKIGLPIPEALQKALGRLKGDDQDD